MTIVPRTWNPQQANNELGSHRSSHAMSDITGARSVIYGTKGTLLDRVIDAVNAAGKEGYRRGERHSDALEADHKRLRAENNLWTRKRRRALAPIAHELARVLVH